MSTVASDRVAKCSQNINNLVGFRLLTCTLAKPDKEILFTLKPKSIPLHPVRLEHLCTADLFDKMRC